MRKQQTRLRAPDGCIFQFLGAAPGPLLLCFTFSLSLLGSFVVLLLHCTLFLLISRSEILLRLLWTKSPVCGAQWPVPERSVGSFRCMGTRSGVSRAAERMCPARHGPQIYGVDVPLRFWGQRWKDSLVLSLSLSLLCLFFLKNTLSPSTPWKQLPTSALFF